MRKPPAVLTIALTLVALACGTARAGVFLSELCDPQNNFQTDRFIEVFNSGPAAVDLTGWSVVAIANNVDVTTWALSGTLAPGTAKVCGNTTTVTGFTVHFQNAQWGASGYFNWNGRVGDGAKLVNPSSVIVDIVVATGTLFENADLVRVASVTGPNPVYTPSEWTSAPVLLATNASPGSHNGSLPPSGGPRLSNIVTDPSTPVTGVGVDVQASAVDPDGPVSSVSLAWGTTSGSQPNTLAMTLLSDSTYRTSAPIPSQPGGATVYYKVTAVGPTVTNTSTLRNYVLAGGGGAPTILAVGEMSDSTFLVQFSEPVEETSAEIPTHYTIGALTGVAAVRDPARTDQVLVTIRNVPAGSQTMVVNGVADLTGNVATGATRSFTYINVAIPPGYYNTTVGLQGSALRVALHNLIKNHTVQSYAFALTAFGTTDIKPNGKIWDMYSDVPGGTPPYEYAYGQTGQGAGEGFGYNREHTFPQSWFNDASPMVSDLHMLYPTDSYVNNMRGNFPFGVVASATNTSQNGSKVGPSATPGYGGTVFEPIGPYKGDLARAHFYVSARYFGQDASWPGSPSADGANFQPWAVTQYLQWSNADPVSWKERMRNGAVYVYQNNRNPFVDHPEFIALIYDTTATSAAESPLAQGGIRLRQNLPNPFGTRTSIGFELARREVVMLRIYDVAGRQVRTLANGRALEPGSHQVDWDGRDDHGQLAEAGLYFCRLDVGAARDTKRMVFAH